jgi:mono/diheme cytochrome c family protein
MSQPSSGSSDNIDYQPTMNVASAHAAAAREHTIEPVKQAPLTNLPLILSAIVFVFAGGFIGSNIGAQKGERPKNVAGGEDPTPPDVKWLKEGASIYSTACQGCHLPTGAGNPASGIPPLSGSEWVIEGEKRLATIVLKGLQGPIPVKGVTYGSAVMNAKGGVALTDKQVAQVLSYVRNNWGHKGSFIMDDQIKALNAEIASLPSPAPYEEIAKIPAGENLPPSKKPIVPGAPAAK